MEKFSVFWVCRRSSQIRTRLSSSTAPALALKVTVQRGMRNSSFTASSSRASPPSCGVCMIAQASVSGSGFPQLGSGSPPEPEAAFSPAKTKRASRRGTPCEGARQFLKAQTQADCASGSSSPVSVLMTYPRMVTSLGISGWCCNSSTVSATEFSTVSKPRSHASKSMPQ